MTVAADCTPVSWLRLERYALGELGGGERTEIAGHLSTCARCRACAEQIAAESPGELPPLPTTTAAARQPVLRVSWRRFWPWRWNDRRHAFALVVAVGVSAVLLSREHSQVGGPRVVAVKGGDVAVELVRERAGSVAWEPTSFASGDRFKLLVTCPPPQQVYADIVVIQRDGPSFPGHPALITCGNRVPLPLAFQITGPGAATVCVLLGENAAPSRAVSANGDVPATIPHACIRLDRAE